MPGSHGAAASECTVIGPDCSPVEARRTRYPLPGDTLRNSSPPSESACCVESVAPAGPISDICAFGARPVTYTCSALPWALKLGAAIAPVAAISPAVTTAASEHALARTRRRRTWPLRTRQMFHIRSHDAPVPARRPRPAVPIPHREAGLDRRPNLRGIRLRPCTLGAEVMEEENV